VTSTPTSSPPPTPAQEGSPAAAPRHARRLTARLVDFVAVVALVLAAQLLVVGAIHLGGPVGIGVEILGWLAFLAVLFLYEPLTTLRFSATPGKLLCGLRIVALDGGPLRRGPVCVRFVAGAVLAVIPFGVIVYGVSVLADRQRRSVADKAAGTRVVQVLTGPR
jgi:uncharacterized RDD family membrane protein YckC